MSRYFVGSYQLWMSRAMVIREISLLEHKGQILTTSWSLSLFLLFFIPDLNTVALQRHTLQMANWGLEPLCIRSIDKLSWDEKECILQVKDIMCFYIDAIIHVDLNSLPVSCWPLCIVWCSIVEIGMCADIRLPKILLMMRFSSQPFFYSAWKRHGWGQALKIPSCQALRYMLPNNKYLSISILILRLVP